MDLVVRQMPVGEFSVHHLSGEVDLATLPRLADALMRATAGSADNDNATTLVVDLDGVHVMDDAGLGLILGAAGRARQAGRDVAVVCSAPTLRQRLTLTGFDRAVTVVDRLSQLR